MTAMDTIKELLSMGFSPISSLCIVAVSALWARIRWTEKNNVKVREDWHSATLARVEEVEKKAEECYNDREDLRKVATETAMKLATLEERTKQYGRCPKAGCPMKGL